MHILVMPLELREQVRGVILERNVLSTYPALYYGYIPVGDCSLFGPWKTKMLPDVAFCLTVWNNAPS